MLSPETKVLCEGCLDGRAKACREIGRGRRETSGKRDITGILRFGETPHLLHHGVTWQPWSRHSAFRPSHISTPHQLAR